jgi:hypothetical protein
VAFHWTSLHYRAQPGRFFNSGEFQSLSSGAAMIRKAFLNQQKIKVVDIGYVVATVVDRALALWPPPIIDLIFPITAINHPAFLESDRATKKVCRHGGYCGAMICHGNFEIRLRSIGVVSGIPRTQKTEGDAPEAFALRLAGESKTIQRCVRAKSDAGSIEIIPE